MVDDYFLDILLFEVFEFGFVILQLGFVNLKSSFELDVKDFQSD